jgi:serine/threonine protein phosphatase PrpC
MSAQAAAELVARPRRDAHVEAAGVTDVGRLRSTNEDAFLIATLQRSINVHQASPGARGWFPGDPAGTLLIVADGMGGQGGGEMASSTAVNAVASYLLNVMPWVNVRANCSPPSANTSLRGELSTAVMTGDETVRAEGAQAGTPRMGTTLTMAFVLWPFVYIAHVGDTRCYLLTSGQLRCLTTDHNLAQKFVEASPRPVEPPEQLQHILWNALGAGIDRAVPDVSKVDIGSGGILLVCSDGLNKHVSDETIQSVLESREPCAGRAAKLVELANAAGGTDNITAIVAEVHAVPGSAVG